MDTPAAKAKAAKIAATRAIKEAATLARLAAEVTARGAPQQRLVVHLNDVFASHDWTMACSGRWSDMSHLVHLLALPRPRPTTTAQCLTAYPGLACLFEEATVLTFFNSQVWPAVLLCDNTEMQDALDELAPGGVVRVHFPYRRGAAVGAAAAALQDEDMKADEPLV